MHSCADVIHFEAYMHSVGKCCAGDYSAGDVLGGTYTVVETLGRGSSGVTYKAHFLDAGSKSCIHGHRCLHLSTCSTTLIVAHTCCLELVHPMCFSLACMHRFVVSCCTLHQQVRCTVPRRLSDIPWGVFNLALLLMVS